MLVVVWGVKTQRYIMIVKYEGQGIGCEKKVNKNNFQFCGVRINVPLLSCIVQLV